MKHPLLSLLLLSATAGSGLAQTTYLPLGLEDYHVLDRLETKSGELSPLLYNGVKPLPRKGLVAFLSSLQDNSQQDGMLTNNVLQEPTDNLESAPVVDLSAVDRYNVAHTISASGEWAPDENGAIVSRRPFLSTFYKRQPDAVYVHTKNFFLSVNPVLSLQALFQKSGFDKFRISNTRGVEVRGWIAKKVGFYTYLADNQEQMPDYVQDYVERRQAVIGNDYYQTPAPTTYDYLSARGYIDFAAVKDHINVTFGYDKHFWGDGVRSLFLSDFSAPYAFLRLNTRIWKLNYQNLFMELTPQYQRAGDRELPHKYATMHHLSMNVTRWLNLGLFEGVIFNRADHYEVSYLVPIIFYRQIERAQGSPDNALLGMNFKALVARRLQFYGQFLLDEFRAKELFGGNDWWGNKFGIQAGGKYFDAFGVKNLDLQGEVNAVRPFTYSHNDTIANYTHYNQPLAHPLGAGFVEVIGKVLYQPFPRAYINLQAVFSKRGVDTGAYTRGFDIFRQNTARTGDYGFNWTGVNFTNTTLLSLHLAYEVRENLFADLSITRRSATSTLISEVNNNMYFNAGFRLNIARRDYNFY